jgi:hypothetical protein
LQIIITWSYRIPDEPNQEQQALVSKAQIAKTKTASLKKGLAKQKTLLSAKKKDLIARQLQLPEELTVFLQSDSTFKRVLRWRMETPRQ